MEKEYPSNSYASKQQSTNNVTAQDKKIDKVISGKARTKKKSILKDALVSEDTSSVKSYIIMEVLIPAFKKAVSDVVTNGIDMILYGETGKSKRRSGSKVSYTSFPSCLAGCLMWILMVAGMVGVINLVMLLFRTMF